MRGRASVVDPHTVEIGGRRFSAKHILLATGSLAHGSRASRRASTPSPRTRLSTWSGCRGGRCSSAAATSRWSSPGSSTASGAEVLRTAADRLLRGFDAELGERLGEEMRAKGMKIRFGGEPQRIDQAPRRQPRGRVQRRLAGRGRPRACSRPAGMPTRRSRPRGGRRQARGGRRGDRRQVLPHLGRFHPCHRRPDQPPRPHAGRDGRGACGSRETLFGNRAHRGRPRNVPTAMFANPTSASWACRKRARARVRAVDVYRRPSGR